MSLINFIHTTNKLKNFLVSFLLFFLNCSNPEDKVNPLEVKLNKLAAHYDLEAIKKTEKNAQAILRRNTRQALRSSQILLEHQLIDTQDFIKYVLPLRVNRTFDSTWRKLVQERYGKKNIINQFHSAKSLIDSCNQVAADLKKLFTFGNTNSFENMLSYSELLKAKNGTCVSMANLAAYSFRALGVPVAIDFVPTWGNLNASGHKWNALITKEKEYPFMGTESDIEGYQPLVISNGDEKEATTYRIPPKVYRESPYAEEGFDFFGTKVVDVTDYYVPTRTIELKDVETEQEVFLATYNNNKFHPCSKAIKRNKNLIFKKMATELIYFPVILKHRQYIPVAPPIANTLNRQINLKPDYHKDQTLNLKSLSSLPESQLNILNCRGYDSFLKMENRNSPKLCPKPLKGHIYALFFWDQKWMMVKEKKCTETGLVFSDIPSNTVYLIVEKGKSLTNCRPFLYKDDEQLWF